MAGDASLRGALQGNNGGEPRAALEEAGDLFFCSVEEGMEERRRGGKEMGKGRRWSHRVSGAAGRQTRKQTATAFRITPAAQGAEAAAAQEQQCASPGRGAQRRTVTPRPEGPGGTSSDSTSSMNFCFGVSAADMPAGRTGADRRGERW